MIAMVQESSAADDSLKMNTDCVYFLASPLTCKKGSECEYRHSEYARFNPRDCYYWLNGNCRNPVCAFRHPPLDGLLGSQTTTSSGSTFLTSQSATAKNVTYNPGKQAILCVFFQKGNCIKGDKCAFSHGLNNASNKLPHAKTASPDRESSNFNILGDLEKISHEQNLPAANFSNSAVVPLRVKLSAKSENRIMSEKNALEATRFSDEVSGLKEISISPETNHSPETSISPESSLSPETSISPESSLSPETSISPVTVNNFSNPTNHLPETDVSDDQSLQNDHNDDEFYRGSSPGLNVLVHDEKPKDLDYYHDDEQFGRRGYGENNHLNEIDVECEMFRDRRGNESYDDSMQRQNERTSVGSDALERWSFRNRLSKQRRHDGSRSSIYHPYAYHHMKRSHHGNYSHRNGILTDSNLPNSLSFEGPKPLSEILKIKRGSGTSISEKDVLEDQRDDGEIHGEHVGKENPNNIDEEEMAELDDEDTDDFTKKIGALFP